VSLSNTLVLFSVLPSFFSFHDDFFFPLGHSVPKPRDGPSFHCMIDVVFSLIFCGGKCPSFFPLPPSPPPSFPRGYNALGFWGFPHPFCKENHHFLTFWEIPISRWCSNPSPPLALPRSNPFFLSSILLPPFFPPLNHPIIELLQIHGGRVQLHPLSPPPFLLPTHRDEDRPVLLSLPLATLQLVGFLGTCLGNLFPHRARFPAKNGLWLGPRFRFPLLTSRFTPTPPPLSCAGRHQPPFWLTTAEFQCLMGCILVSDPKSSCFFVSPGRVFFFQVRGQTPFLFPRPIFRIGFCLYMGN